MLVSQKIILTIHKNISDNQVSDSQVSVLAKSNIAVVKKANVSLKLAIYSDDECHDVDGGISMKVDALQTDLFIRVNGMRK